MTRERILNGKMVTEEQVVIKVVRVGALLVEEREWVVRAERDLTEKEKHDDQERYMKDMKHILQELSLIEK
jgi:hypothetical protein